MSIEFHCTSCEALLRVPDDAAGQQTRCPSCSATLQVPTAGAPTDSSPGTMPGGGSPNLNPYASPITDVSEQFQAAPDGRSDVVPTVIEIGDVLTRSWEIYKSHFWICVGVVAVAFVLSQVASQMTNVVVIPLQAAGADPLLVLFANIVFMLAAFVFNFWIITGQTLFLIQLARGNDADFIHLFSGGRYLLRAIGFNILLMLIGFAIAVAGAVPVGVVYLATNDGQITLLVALVIGIPVLLFWIYVNLMYSQSVNLIIDRNMGVIESMQASQWITKRNKLSIFVLGLLFALLGLAGLAACCIGLFATLPLGYLISAVAYLVMSGQPTLYSPTSAG